VVNERNEASDVVDDYSAFISELLDVHDAFIKIINIIKVNNALLQPPSQGHILINYYFIIVSIKVYN